MLIRPAGLRHADAVAEVMESLLHGLRALGVDVDLAENAARPDAINIVFMAFYLGAEQILQLPPDTILYNFEQAGGALNFLTAAFRAGLARYRIWDYSQRNMDRLQDLIGHERRQVVPVGYVPALSRIPRAAVQDIDVLFYGALNERRRAILTGLQQQSGLRLHAVQGVYGAERDALIARAKLVLNIHAHDSKVLEVVRISYLLANRKAVVAEMDETTEIEPDLRDAIAGAPADGLAALCRELIEDAERRHALEDRGYDIFRRRDLVPILRRAITDAAR
ncbi:MAG: hypothetical protein WDN69_34635 [Aliidongia sp.]